MSTSVYTLFCETAGSNVAPSHLISYCAFWHLWYERCIINYLVCSFFLGGGEWLGIFSLPAFNHFLPCIASAGFRSQPGHCYVAVARIRKSAHLISGSPRSSELINKCLFSQNLIYNSWWLVFCQWNRFTVCFNEILKKLHLPLFNWEERLMQRMVSFPTWSHSRPEILVSLPSKLSLITRSILQVQRWVSKEKSSVVGALSVHSFDECKWSLRNSAVWKWMVSALTGSAVQGSAFSATHRECSVHRTLWSMGTAVANRAWGCLDAADRNACIHTSSLSFLSSRSTPFYYWPSQHRDHNYTG